MALAEISVIVVNYKADTHVERLRRAFQDAQDIEFIVIDHSHEHRGYSEGINTGVRLSHGAAIVCCNPDVSLTPESVRNMVRVLQSDPNRGVVGPQIVNERGVVQITCSALPDPLISAVEWSFLRRWPLASALSRRYRLHDFDHQSSRTVPTLNGSCFAMRRADFERIGGLDQGYFLYFEEFDLAQKMKRRGKQLYFSADVQVTHIGQVSTKEEMVTTHFLRSRRRYLKKWFGTTGVVAARFLEHFEQQPPESNESVAVASLVRELDPPTQAFQNSVSEADAVHLISDGSSATWKRLAKQRGWSFSERVLGADFAAQRNAVLEQIHQDWTIFLDTDEQLSPEWWEEFARIKGSWKNEVGVLRRHDIFHGKSLQFGEVGAQRLVRVARTGTSRRSWTRAVHETWDLPWHATYVFHQPILHFAHASIESFWRDLMRYVMREPLPRPLPTTTQIVVMMIVLPIGKFLQNFILRSGWRDGWRGGVYAFLMSVYSLMKRVRWYEARHQV